MRSILAARRVLWQNRAVGTSNVPRKHGSECPGLIMVDFDAARTAMVDCQVRPSDVTRYNIIDAMLTVPRENFVPAGFRDVAYSEADIAIGDDGRVVLAPRTMGKMLDAAAITSDDTVLYVGAGYGYGAALIARMAAVVIAVEPNEKLAEAARSRLADIEVGNAIIEKGPLYEGAKAHAPYDVIFVEGAIEVIPDALIDQLSEDGRVVAIVSEGGANQARVGVKSLNSLAWRRAFDATAPILSGFNVKKSFEF